MHNTNNNPIKILNPLRVKSLKEKYLKMNLWKNSCYVDGKLQFILRKIERGMENTFFK